MQINVTYDSSVAGAPAAFKTIVADVVQFFDATFSNPITINIDVGWGEVDGQALGSRSLGESLANFDNNFFSYDQVVAALTANATSPNAKEAVASLPAGDPTNGGPFSITTAEAKALGLLGASSDADGYVGFDSSPGTFDFSVTSNSSGSVASGEFDLFGVIAHEFSEVMGRQMNFGAGGFGVPGDGSGYEPMDLFDFSAPGARSFAPRTNRYFSIDGGNTSLGGFNSQLSGDKSDWDGSTADAFNAQSAASIVNPVTAADLTLMNVLGYQPGPDFTAPYTPVLHGPNYTFSVINTGGAASASSMTIYGSSSVNFDQATSTPIATAAIPALAAGGAYDATIALKLPSALAAGPYYLTAVANADNAVAEANTANNITQTLAILVLDSANVGVIDGVSGEHSFDLGGLSLAGALKLDSDLTVAAALGGAGSLNLIYGELYVEPGANLTLAALSVGQASTMEVDAAVNYAGSFTESQGTLTVDAGGVFNLAGANDTIASTITGAGTLGLTGGETTFESGSSLHVAEVTLSGGSTTADMATSFTYPGKWTQTSGTLSVDSGKSVAFSGVGDSFSGTLTGASRVNLSAGSDTLRNVTISGSGVIVDGAVVTLAGQVIIDSTLGATGANLTIALTNASILGGGTLALSNSAANRIVGATASATLNLTAGKITGAGDIGGGQMKLWIGAAGTIQSNGSVALVIDTGANSIISYGLIEATGAGGLTIASAVANGGELAALGGSLTVDGAVSGGGSVRINGATADFAAAFSQNVTFGATGVLELAQSQAYHGIISGFSHTGGNSIDLRDVAFGATTVASFSGSTASGVLTVSDGTHTAKIKLAGNFLKSSFNLSSDGQGGTTVVDPTSAPLTHAMAAFAPAAGLAGSASYAALGSRLPLLASPHTAKA